MSAKGEVKSIGLAESSGELSRIKIFRECCTGLEGLDDFSHNIMLYWFYSRDNEEERHTLKVIPRKHPSAQQIGVFASRSPSRPNPMGPCVAKLIKNGGFTMTAKGPHGLEGSPIIDVIPYIPRADAIPEARVPEWTSHGPQA